MSRGRYSQFQFSILREFPPTRFFSYFDRKEKGSTVEETFDRRFVEKVVFEINQGSTKFPLESTRRVRASAPEK